MTQHVVVVVALRAKTDLQLTKELSGYRQNNSEKNETAYTVNNKLVFKTSFSWGCSQAG